MRSYRFPRPAVILTTVLFFVLVASPATNALPVGSDLSLVGSDAPDPVVAGQTLTYTLMASNAGPDPATGVTMITNLPSTATFGSATPAQGSCSQALGVVTCSIGSVASGASVPVTISMVPTAVGSILGGATVSSLGADPDPTNNATTLTTLVNSGSGSGPGTADVGIAGTDTPDPATTGAILTYHLTVTNAGPDAAEGVAVTDTLPAAVAYGSATASQGSCSQAAVLVTCQLGTVASGSQPTVTITVTPIGAGVAADGVAITSTTVDPNPTNNLATITTTVSGATLTTADLGLAGTASPDPATVGKTLNYAFTVANAGPSTATGVTLADTLPAGATFGTATASQGSCSQAAALVTCDLGSLGSAAQATVAITVTPTAAGAAADAAAVASTTLDPNPANNALLLTTPVNGPATGGGNCGGLVATIVGTLGNDLLKGTPGNDVIIGLGGNDVITGLGGNDVICGGGGNDTLVGGAGNDRLVPGPGADKINGGSGTDTVVFDPPAHGVRVNLAKHRATGQGKDRIRGVENVVGTPHNDVLLGNRHPNRMMGLRGNDRIVGRAGNDVLVGGPGKDRLRGGPGNDTLNGGPGADSCLQGPGRGRRTGC